MSDSIRIFQLAKEINISHNDILDFLKSKDISVSSLDTVFEGHSLMMIRLEKVEKQTSNKDEEVDLDWIRPDLREALDRKEASHDVNRPEAVKAKTLALRDVIDHISHHVMCDMTHSQNQVTDHVTDDVTHG